MHPDLRIVATCPESCTVDPGLYPTLVAEHARRGEAAGHHGLLVLSDHRLLDPWVVAQIVLEASARLRPVVAVQPLDVHPYAAARKIASLAALYGRPPDIVLVAGGWRTDLVALDDRTAHDVRYRRLVEYGDLIGRLLRSTEPVQHEGATYRLYQPRVLPPLSPENLPNVFVAASSSAGRDAATELGAHGVVPLLPGVSLQHGDGVRVGIVARDDAESAGRIARLRFPDHPAQRLEQRLEMQWADSRWQQQLEEVAEGGASPYWLHPFEHRHAQTPYLVGDHRTVSRALRPAFEAGCRWLFLDASSDDDDLEHAHEAIRRAWNRASSPLALSG